MKEWDKLLLQESSDLLHRKIPTAEGLQELLLSQQRSKFPLRYLGDGELPVYLTEESRESHIHILGAPGQGKSKLLELLIRQDLQLGYGACLLDPSDNGDTMYKVLRWYIKYTKEKGLEPKVVIIDPHDSHKKTFETVPTIAPRHNLMDTVRILFDQRSFSETPRIQKYLPAVLHVLAESNMTLAELVYFTDQRHPMYAARREAMFEVLHPLDRKRIDLEEVFRTRQLFTNEFESTIRRMEPFLDFYMKCVFGSRTGIDFRKMIRDGWLILVNLDPHGVSRDFGQEHQRLLGTAVIHELMDAILTLRRGGWEGVYYLYIDEVGDYATRSLATALDKMRKSGLRLTMAHQRFAQIEDRYVADAIMTGAKIKVLFQTANPEDRLRMVKMMYGGELSDRQVAYVVGALAKQQAAIKIEKQPAILMRLRDVPDTELEKEQMDEFKRMIYNRDKWYHSPEAILKETRARFTTPESSPRLAPRKSAPSKEEKPKAKPDRKGAARRESPKPDKAKDTPDARPRTLFDDIADSPTVLRDQKRRSSRKVLPDTPEGTE